MPPLKSKHQNAKEQWKQCNRTFLIKTGKKSSHLPGLFLYLPERNSPHSLGNPDLNQVLSAFLGVTRYHFLWGIPSVTYQDATDSCLSKGIIVYFLNSFITLLPSTK